MKSKIHGREKEALLARLAELEEALRAIRAGEVDALIYSDGDGDEIFSRQGAELAYRSMIETMSEGAAILIGGQITYCNRYFANLLRLPLEHVIGRFLLDFIPQEAHENLTTMLAAAQHELTRDEVVFLDSAGQKLTLQTSLSVLEINESKALCMVATDLTPRVLEKLRMAASVYESSSEAMVVTDENNIIISANPAFERITGYAVKDVVGKNPRLLNSGLQDHLFYAEMWHAVRTKGHWSGEIWNKRKSGEIYAEWLNINVIKDESGTPSRYIGLFTEITDKKKTEKLIWMQANFDSLTNLPNRRLFTDRLEQAARRAVRTKNSMALLLLDLDSFKDVNDNLGHLMGDELLIEVAKRLNSCVRESDTVSRLGGDEFTVILTDITDLHDIEKVSKTILNNISRPYSLGGEDMNITASLGIAVCPADSHDPMNLMKGADLAMYKAKNEGKNQYCYFSKSLEEKSILRANLVKDLQKALPNKEFELYFQPVVNLRTGKLEKAEALLRWNHPERGMVSPIEFISVAEETGAIVEIGDWVFSESLRSCKRWSEMLGFEFKIGVNVSPVQLQSKESTDKWAESLLRADVSGKAVIVEITEGFLLNDKPDVFKALLEFRDLGIEVAIDDFGTGYSSLSYLNKFDIDYLKIDQSFTRNLQINSSEMALSKAIILMAHELGIKVIAEGIETEEQKILLAATGCDFGQGYLFSRPVPANEFETMLLAQRSSESPPIH